jgi:MFS superfamily sulfate permease-like transporter
VVDRAFNPSALATPGALVVRSTSAWLYFNSQHIRRRITAMIDSAPPGTRIVVLDFSTVLSIDITAVTILRALARSLRERDIAVEIAELRDEVAETLKVVGAEHDLDRIVVHLTIEECLARSKAEHGPPPAGT